MNSSFTFLIQFTKSRSLRTRFVATNESVYVSPEQRLMNTSRSLEDQLVSMDKENIVGEIDQVESEISSNEHDCAGSEENSLIIAHLLPEPPTKHIVLQKSCELRLALKSVIHSWSTLHELHCREFFSPTQLNDCLNLYWTMWHPNWPVLHRPTFDIKAVPAPLLAAMVLVGACFSQKRHVSTDARPWFDAVEALAFYDLELITTGDISHRRIQSIQAAYLVCVYQGWNGEASAAFRVRHQRFDAIVTAVRRLDISSVKHTIFGTFEAFSWIDYIHMEEKIRTLLWVFLLDSAYVIFNNIPPRLVCRELRMGVASCEASYQANTAQECFARLQAWRNHNTRPASVSLYNLIKLFFMKDLPASTLENLAYESFMNLWCVNAACHIAIFNIDLDLGGESQLHSVQIALANWAAVWTQRRRNDDEGFFDFIVANDEKQFVINNDDWRRPGFWKNVLEYWSLADSVLKRMIATRASAQAADDLCGIYGYHREVSHHIGEIVDDTSMDNLHQFLLNSR